MKIYHITIYNYDTILNRCEFYLIEKIYYKFSHIDIYNYLNDTFIYYHFYLQFDIIRRIIRSNIWYIEEK